MEELLTIGELGRASGLPVSALRFYDGAGVLVPASVDRRTGYRRYGLDQVAAARLVARLRRIGMPLADVRALLGGAEPGPVLDAHLARLEDGLAAARRELSAVRALLDRSEPAVQFTVPATALDAVRYAVGTDPSYPALHGVLLDADSDTLHVVASDRYRLAVATAPAGGASGRVFVPVAVVDELRGLGGTVTVRTADGELTATAGGRTVRTPVVPDEFPDWRRLEPPPAQHQVPLDGPAFRAALAGGPAVRKDRDGIPYDAVVLTLGPAGELTVGADTDGLRTDADTDEPRTDADTDRLQADGDTGRLQADADTDRLQADADTDRLQADADTDRRRAVGDAGGPRADAEGDEPRAGVLRIGVNRDFLLDALADHAQLTLELDGPITPLAIRLPDRSHWSLLMPVRLDA